MILRVLLLCLILLSAPLHEAEAGRARIAKVARDPWVSTLLLNGNTGEVLAAENADATVYPASTLKMMNLLVILEQIREGRVRLDDMVQVTREAARMGGSQVYLDPSEQFSVEDLLYALMIQSANDAAVALAIHVAGSKEAFVEMMNRKAAELGMRNTRFHSVHGLPPSTGQQVDVTTARDFGKLALALAGYPEAFVYTSTRVREFRGGEFIMRTHNHLLEQVAGCDGFKTGYFAAAGFSIVATAKRNGVRIIALVMGSADRKVRDATAIKLLNRGFTMVPSQPEPVRISRQKVAEPATPAVVSAPEPAPGENALPAPPVQDDTPDQAACGWGRFFLGMGAGFLLSGVLYLLVLRKRRPRNRRLRRL